MGKTLSDLLTNEALLKLAGERAFERGVAYFENGQVVGLKEANGIATASVRGTYYYRVKLWTADGDVAFDCNCPVGQDDVFCKHCVAVGLAWFDRLTENDGGNNRLAGRDLTDEEIRSHLMSQDKRSLVDFILSQAESDSEFRERLVLAAAKRNGDAPDLAVFRGAIDKAICHRGFMQYGQMPEYARGIEMVLDSLSDLLKRHHGNEVRELAEHALNRIESAMNDMDDSDGFMSGILDRLQELHLAACRKARPDPKALAKFLFEWEINGDWEIFFGAAETYADVLGDEGLAVYRKLAEAEWAKVPPLAPGEKGSEVRREHWRITHMMEALAKQQGDIEALVAVKSRNLSLPYAFLQIAQIYKSSGNSQAALEWAERGVRAFPGDGDKRLYKFLIDEYHGRKRHDDAIAIAWLGFCEHPRLDEYKSLRRGALRAKKWRQWRKNALALLHERINCQTQGPGKHGPRESARANHSDLIEIYLWEGDTENAWKEATAGSCRNDLWLRLAEARAKDHPEDAIAVYSKQLKRSLQWVQQSAYEEAVGILQKIEQLMIQIETPADFPSLIQSIRAQYKPRRNLMKLLDAQGWLAAGSGPRGIAKGK